MGTPRRHQLSHSLAAGVPYHRSKAATRKSSVLGLFTEFREHRLQSGQNFVGQLF